MIISRQPDCGKATIAKLMANGISAVMKCITNSHWVKTPVDVEL